MGEKERGLTTMTNKITIDIEYEKFGTFGRTHCHANLYVYENEYGDLMSKEAVEKVVTTLRKLFTNKNLFNPCVTFSHRNIDTESFGMGHNTGRIFGFSGDSYDIVKWGVTGDVRATVKSITKKVIMDMYEDCVDKCNNPTYCVRGA